MMWKEEEQTCPAKEVEFSSLDQTQRSLDPVSKLKLSVTPGVPMVTGIMFEKPNVKCYRSLT
jgi:hypothetical protein